MGETLSEREDGLMHDVLKRQLQAFAEAIPDHEEIIVAYEPVWAIGTGRSASGGQAEEAHAFLRKMSGQF